MDADDLELFIRSIRHAAEQRTGAALDTALEDLGWYEALHAEPSTAVAALFEVQGEANVTSAGIDRVILSALGRDAGDVGTAVVLPALGGWAPPGAFDGSIVTVAGLGTSALTTGRDVLIGATDGDGAVVVVSLAPADLKVRTVVGVDERLGLVEVEGAVTAVDPSPAEWATAVQHAQLAIGHELVGASRTMLRLAREHALERVQFGKPISQFQAVRHRLAEALVAIETAATALSAAWEHLTPQTAAMAKALAGSGARTAARHCQQVLAGIGFTAEHDFHLVYKRTLVLDGLFGSAKRLTKQLGEDIISSRQLPAPIPL